MKKVAIIGGLGPESTFDYYKGIIDAFKPIYNKHGYPEIIIESLNLKEILSLAESNNWIKIAQIVSSKFNYLKESGADFGVIASNTPHIIFHEIQNKTKLPLISIVSETHKYIKQLNINSVCLLGTKFTMESDFYIKELQNSDINTVVPNLDEIEYIHEKLMTEIELGIIKNSTKNNFIKIINRIQKESQIEGVILGCTELPLIIKQEDIDLQYIDTMKIHIDSIVKQIIVD